jgi:hypothetical protein
MNSRICICLVLSIACNQAVDKANVSLINNGLKFPYIKGLGQVSDSLYQVSHMQVPLNYIIYNGDVSDTIDLTGPYDRYKEILPFEYYNRVNRENRLKIFVSDRQLLPQGLSEIIRLNEFYTDTEIEEGGSNHNSKKKVGHTEKRQNKFVPSIPVFLYNPTNDTILFQIQNGRVIMIQEAKDEHGVWRPIEFWQYSWCGNSYHEEVLLPNNIAIVKVLKYDGDFETELRLKLKSDNTIIYSDSFKGKINKSQFKLPSSIFGGKPKDDSIIPEYKGIMFLDHYIEN